MWRIFPAFKKAIGQKTHDHLGEQFEQVEKRELGATVLIWRSTRRKRLSGYSDLPVLPLSLRPHPLEPSRIEDDRRSGYKSGVKRFLSLLMLLGALTGLFGQEAAYAAGPAFAPVAVVGMASDCMMMHKAPATRPMPCKGLTLDCIAAMGCAAPLMVAPAPALVVKTAYEPAQYAPSSPEVLAGRALGPEPRPPLT